MPADAAPRAVETAQLEEHRRALTGFCYRMLGSGSEAEDAVQETMVRAWRNADRLQAQGALKSWLHRIATNVCLDMLQGPQRRALPMDLGPSGGADAFLGQTLPEHAWVQPVADGLVLPDPTDPARVAEGRETLRLAFVAALQHLPPRQRAVLILCEVLQWRAAEVAELLDTTVASVNSALQRARATLASLDLTVDGPAGAPAPLAAEEERLLARYVDAFERYDIDELVGLLHEDATFSMPPFPLWLRGREEAGRFMLGQGAGCRGSRLLSTRANGNPAAAIYHPKGDGRYEPWALVVVETSAGRIGALHHFIGPAVFEAFGLPGHLQADDVGEPGQLHESAQVVGRPRDL